MHLLKNIDYYDCFENRTSASPTPLLKETVYKFFTSWPKWMITLFIIRNILVLPFGLKGGRGKEIFSAPKLVFQWKENGKVGFFDLVSVTENEATLLIRDKHLDAGLIFTRIITNETTIIEAKTIVQYNNDLGKLYFFFIKPFHKLIMKSMLKQL